MEPSKEVARPVSYFPISPMMLFPDALGNFSVYLWQGGDFVLYTRSGQKFTERHRERLHQNGTKEVYVQSGEKPDFDRYLEENLGSILVNDALPIEDRSKVFYEASTSVVEDVFRSKLPTSLSNRYFERVSSVVENSMRFLSSDNSLSAIAPFISHDYKTYTHCIHVFIFTVSMLNSYNLSEKEIYECGLGAMLHDLGKTNIPRAILNKRGKLTTDERRVINNHPMHGVSMCSMLPLSQNTINCILFHHEKMDGSGYPAGLSGEDIPLPVRAIAVADVYDALTSSRPYAEAMQPYEALTLMRHEMRTALDVDVFKRFVAVLGGADII